MEQGYISKDLCFDNDARAKLIKGITAISKAVKSTLGPRGQTVVIESPHHTHGITVTKDGVTVAKSVDRYDPVENLAVRMMKEAAISVVRVGESTWSLFEPRDGVFEFGWMDRIIDKFR